MNARWGIGVGGKAGFLAVAAILAAVGTGAAQVAAPTAPQERVPTQMRPQSGTREACEALRGLRMEDTTIEVSGLVNDGGFTPPGSVSTLRNLPRFCRVIGVTRPAIRFEVWLPIEKWSGRFEVVGNGGMAGVISYSAMASALRRGNAAASTDTGHVNQLTSGFDASWALDRPDLVVDFSYRGLHLTTAHGKRIVGAFYGRAAEHSYYVGCSKGGGQGLMEAQRYPTDFDGIVAGDPAYNWTNLYTGAHLYYSQVMLKDPDSYIQPAKVKILADAVNKACDGKDGFADGVVSDPLSCRVDLNEIACKAGEDPGSCFTSKQIEAVKRIWAGAKDDQGRVIFPGLLPGGEAGSGGWSAWVTGSAPRQGTHWKAADSFFRYMVMGDEKYDPLSFDYDRERDRKQLEKLVPILNADSPDLRPFARRGGKLILYHGLSDPDISPVNTINYYQRMEDVSGMNTRGFARLFLAPGMQHCAGGPGPDQFDAVSAVERWVEEGVAPEKIIASHLTHGQVDRSRPLCPYPQVAVYSGKGSAVDASSFVCKVPGAGAKK